jgi:16S rRNA (guanine527-N7)-methyltransferase
MRDFSDKYLELLATDYSGINLTRILDSDEFYHKQIMDSVLPSNDGKFREQILGTKLVVDIGFGGGFPILPLAKTFPDVRFIGLEARAKKVQVVTEIAAKLGLGNVGLHHYRVEEVYFDLPCAITLKAVGDIADFLALIQSERDVSVFFYKGPLVDQHEDLSKVQSQWKLVERREISVPGADGRIILGYKGRNVLRGTKKTLVKLSQLI